MHFPRYGSYTGSRGIQDYNFVDSSPATPGAETVALIAVPQTRGLAHGGLKIGAED